MVWKVLTILLTICLLVYCLSMVVDKIYIPERKLKQCSTYGTIILDKMFDKSLLSHQIVKVIKMLSPVPYVCRGIIPITNRISHWLLALKLDNNKVVVVNTSSKVFITVYNGRINQKRKLINYNDYIGIVKRVYTLNNPILLSTFLNKYIAYFKNKYKQYTLFGHDNCQHIVSDCLTHIFGITDNETKCEKYDLGILKEIYKTNKHATDFKNIIP